MKFERIWALGLLSAFADASFQGTSPFFAFTTSSRNSFSRLADAPNIIFGFKFSMSVDSIARSCASDAYVLVSQPGVSDKDFSTKNAAPHLSRRLGFGEKSEPSITERVVVPEVIGDLSTSGLRNRLQSGCKATISRLDAASGEIALPEDSQNPMVLTLDLPALPPPSQPKDRAAKLAAHDSYLNAVIEHLPSKSYTVVFTTTAIPEELTAPIAASDEHAEHVDGPDAWGSWIPVEELHTDLRRQVHDQPPTKRQSKNQTYDRALFEKYNYLSPALFMGIMVTLILVSILSVGISAISGLQVTYGSFTKEYAQAAKKQQQQQQQ